MIFGKFDTISYDFDGVTQTVKNLNTEYDLTEYESEFYGKKIDENVLLDKLSFELFKGHKYYFAPLYTSKILNPFEELPPPSKKIEDNLQNYTAIFGNFSATFAGGELIGTPTSGFSAGFDITTNFAYVLDYDLELKKIKALMVGTLGTGSLPVYKKVDGKWQQTTSILIYGSQNYSDSPAEFINQNNVVITDSDVTQYYLTGTPTGGYVSVNEKEKFINNTTLINVPKDSVIKLIEENVNGSS